MGPAPKEKPFRKIVTAVKAHKSGLLFLLALSLILISGVGLLAWMQVQPVPQPLAYQKPSLPKAKASPKFYSPLTGLEVPDEATTHRPATATMIENSPDARPQSGLKAAGVVYEAIAEAGITRFLAVYQEAQPSLIGPVRSLRPYFLEWAAPYDGAIAHVGGSKRALDEVRNGTYKDIDQFFNGGSYWRSTDRYAPHNVYTNFDRLNALEQKKSYASSDFTSFARKADQPSKQPNATTISVPISGALYNSAYNYNATSNSYDRSEGGHLHLDREAGQLSPKAVIIMRIAMTSGFEDGWREQMSTSGRGEAYVFQDGTVVKAVWSKNSPRQPLKLLNPDGSTLKLNPGQVWLTAIGTDRVPSWQ